MRIRTAAITYITAVAVLVAAGSGALAWREWNRVSEVENVTKLMRVFGAASRFVEALALERGVYNQVIVATNMTAEAKERLVADRVAFTDMVFDDTFAALSRASKQDAASIRPAIDSARGLVRHARGQGDVAWRDPAPAQSDVARAVVGEFVSAGGVLDGAMIRLQRSVSQTDARLGQMVTVSRLSNEMREAAGQRSTILSRYAGTREKLDTATVLKVAELTGTIHSTWSRLKRFVAQIEKSPKLAAAVADTERSFVAQGEPVYSAMASAAREGTEPPMAFLPWRAWTVEMLTKTLTARDAPINQALADLSEMRAAAATRLWFVLAGGIVAVVLSLLGGFFVERRIVKPLALFTAALAADGESDEAQQHPSARFEERTDEIGALWRALRSFQERGSALRDLNHRFEVALSNMSQGLVMFDSEQRLVVCNHRYMEVYRLPRDLARPGTTMREILQWRVERGMYGGSNPEQYIQDRIDNAARGVSSDSVIELADGRTISVAHRPMPGGGWVATHEDITERREAEAQIAHMAHHDSLTDLPNRVLFRNRMHQALARVQRGDHAAVLCLDIDRFKSVNDTLGHPVGDMLLRAVAERLRGCIRETDTVARLGGDEFAILQVGADQPSGASGLARRIVDVLSEPYDLGGHHVVVGTSIGVALAPTDATDVDELLKNADLALYRAKAEGRARYRFFEREMDARVQDRRLLEVDLRKALSAGEFELYYQPLMNLERNEVSGFEALIRWHHPERGMVSPADFIPFAEEIGLIVPIGEWVLREACSQAANWPTEIKLAVNLSPAQFRTRTLVSTVVRALAASGLAASRLELEITESVLLRDDEANLGTLHQLRRLGVRISLDDFGTGYSSLSYLRSFPFDKIKIDQSFVRELSSRSDCAAIVEAVATLGRTLGMATTAEGVETREQLDELRSKGCTEAQGYLFSRPRPAHELWELFPGAPLSSAVA